MVADWDDTKQREVALAALELGQKHIDLTPIKKDIKPCPFCGGEAELHNCAEMLDVTNVTGVGIHCTKCHIATIPYKTEDDAIDVWNNRI